MDNLRRRYELDWLRTIAILILLFFHTGRIFDGGPWHIKNSETDIHFDQWLAFTSAWRMPLLFFVSGVGSYIVTQRRSLGAYIGLRFRRLIVPLIFGVLVILPPQVYYGHINEFASFGDFLKSVFNYIPFYNGGLNLHHLWFIINLFCYSLIALPLLALLRAEWGKEINASLSGFIGNPAVIVLVPGTCMAITQYIFLPGHEYSASFSLFFQFFLFGIVIYSNPVASDLTRYRRFFFTGSILLVVVFFWTYLYIAAGERAHIIFVQTLHHVSIAYLGWFMVITTVAYGQRYLNSTNRWLPLLNEGIYPFYILHQTVIVVLGYYVVQWPWSISAKFWFISLSTLVICVTIYALLIRPFKVTRFLFGMK